jgi:mycothiol synthase
MILRLYREGDFEQVASLFDSIAVCRVRSGIGWVGIHAVRRPWRRRGLGRALLQHSFVELHRRGYDRVGLGVGAESLTGANRLYESAGMQVVRQVDIFEKRLG